jgi:hypothetical protein
MSDVTSPQPAKKGFNLETATNIAIIVLCVVASAALIRNFFFRPQGPQAPDQVKVGERIEAVKPILPAGSARTLVVAISPTCHFCNDSMPFYQRLMSERDKKGSAVKVVGAVPSPDVQKAEAEHLATAQVSFDGLSPVDFQKIKVPGTPTLLLVDAAGKVEKVWVGKLDESGEKEVLAAL